MTESAYTPTPRAARRAAGRARLPSWRLEALRTTLWVVPTLLLACGVVLFLITFSVDVAALHHDFTLPGWLRTGSADAGREILIAIAAAVITVVGVVFSITILALTLASQQFGPRMMRSFIRDVGSQVTLGVFVGTFVYSVLALGSIASISHGSFVPHLTIFVAEALLLVDVGVLIYFIHHIAKIIQLPEVIASIARDLLRAIDAEYPTEVGEGHDDAIDDSGRTVDELLATIEARGEPIAATESGYLQYVGYAQLVRIAAHVDAVIRLDHLPGHFLVEGHRLATVWPRGAAAQVALALEEGHVAGPHRTLIQDPVFAIDQLVEIAIRALSPAVNDTFTALTCIDWLSAGLSRVSGRVLREGVFRDQSGKVRLIASNPSYERMVNRAFDKVRQAAGGMPAVLIRLLTAIDSIAEATTSDAQRAVLMREADMIVVLSDETVAQPDDRRDVRERYDRLCGTLAALDGHHATRGGLHP